MCLTERKEYIYRDRQETIETTKHCNRAVGSTVCNRVERINLGADIIVEPESRERSNLYGRPRILTEGFNGRQNNGIHIRGPSQDNRTRSSIEMTDDSPQTSRSRSPMLASSPSYHEILPKGPLPPKAAPSYVPLEQARRPYAERRFPSSSTGLSFLGLSFLPSKLGKDSAAPADGAVHYDFERFDAEIDVAAGAKIRQPVPIRTTDVRTKRTGLASIAGMHSDQRIRRPKVSIPAVKTERQTDEPLQRCVPCDVTFSSTRALLRHKRESKRHQELASDNSSYKPVISCPECQQTFTRQHDYRRHTAEQHGLGKLPCHTCGKITRPGAPHKDDNGNTCSREQQLAPSYISDEIMVDTGFQNEPQQDVQFGSDFGEEASNDQIQHKIPLKYINDFSEFQRYTTMAEDVCMLCNCPFELDNQAALSLHLDSHFQDFTQGHPCEHCNIGFVHLQDLQKHQSWVNQHQCGIEFVHVRCCEGHHPSPPANSAEGETSMTQDRHRFCVELRRWEHAVLQLYLARVKSLNKRQSRGQPSDTNLKTDSSTTPDFPSREHISAPQHESTESTAQNYESLYDPLLWTSEFLSGGDGDLLQGTNQDSDICYAFPADLSSGGRHTALLQEFRATASELAGSVQTAGKSLETNTSPEGVRIAVGINETRANRSIGTAADGVLNTDGRLFPANQSDQRIYENSKPFFARSKSPAMDTPKGLLKIERRASSQERMRIPLEKDMLGKGWLESARPERSQAKRYQFDESDRARYEMEMVMEARQMRRERERPNSTMWTLDTASGDESESARRSRRAYDQSLEEYDYGVERRRPIHMYTPETVRRSQDRTVDWGESRRVRMNSRSSYPDSAGVRRNSRLDDRDREIDDVCGGIDELRMSSDPTSRRSRGRQWC